MKRLTMADSNSNSEISGESFDEEESANGVTSSSSSDSTDEEDTQQDSLEMAKINNELLKLPRGLCENSNIFKEFFSMSTWQLLSENFRTYLMNKHLPIFSKSLADDSAEKNKSIEMLFNNQLTRFGKTPMVELQRNLEEGNFRPDVLKLRRSITKSQKREQRFRACERISQMARHLFISRERLLRTTYKSSPGEGLFNLKRAPKRNYAQLHQDSSISSVRARKRFINEIRNIAQQCDINDLTDEESSLVIGVEDDPEGVSRLTSSADDQNITRNNPASTEKCIYGTQFKRKQDAADEDAARAQYESKQLKLNNLNFKQYLMEHKRRKIVEPNLPEYETTDIRLRDVYTRAQVGGNFKRVFASGKTPGRKPKSKIKSSSSFPIFTNSNMPEKIGEEDTAYVKTENEVQPTKLDEFSGTDQLKLESFANNNIFENTNDNYQIKESTQFDSLNNVFVKQQKLQRLEKQSFEQNVNITTSEPKMPTLVFPNEVLLPKASADECTKANSLWLEPVNVTRKHQTVPTLPANQTAALDQESSSLYNTPEHISTYEVNANHIAPNVLMEMGAMKDGTTCNNGYVIDKSVKPEAGSHQLDINGCALTKQTLLPPSSPELIQETHACFFSLLRDFFCATANHRMKFEDLREKVSVWLCNPITALNDWYSLADNWAALLTSAINFLAGDFADQPEEYVPYIEYKTLQNIYQWIGAGRDSDARLLELSKYWLSCRNKISEKTYEQKMESNSISNETRRHSTEAEDTNAYERGISPPPAPRYPTTWTVVASTPEEVAEFQQQERERFENPHRAFTYRMHGYESVVGPVKGIYTQILALTKARGHSMMIGDRPNFVTILTLVRDATARLPNGEGTRADISELLKCSQYINRDAAENVLQTIVSGALDRMHTEHDPCVRYDPKRKIWIYLHRNRSEEEFERMHQQYQGIGKHKKPTNRKTKPKSMKEISETDYLNSSLATGVVVGTTVGSSTNMFSLPALVPANPIIVNTAFNQTSKPQQLQPPVKCPPVPPLKYNIHPNHQQKSLLKPTRSADLKAKDSCVGSVQTEVEAKYPTNLQKSTASITPPTPIATSASTSLISFPNKSLSFSGATTPTSRITNIGSSNNTTPIIVATPTGLKTVHVSNATSVSSSNSSPSIQLVKNDVRHATVHATLGGKKVALNKPIIINQVTQQKNKSPQSQLKQLQKQSQQQSFIIPAMHLSSSTNEQTNLISDNDMQTNFAKDSRTSQSVFIEKTKISNNQDAQHGYVQSNNKNIIRLLPSTGTQAGKSVLTVPLSTTSKQPSHIIGQRVLTNPQAIQKPVGGISLISSSSGGSSVPPGAIVRMSSQAFATLQQQQQQQKQTQQHVLVKPTANMQQQRVVMGRTVINPHLQSAASSNKSIIVQQMPGTLVSTQKTSPGGQDTTNFTSKCLTSVISISPQATNSKIQTINANNLTAQQQKILLQNLKQQSVIQQFKTVQVLANSSQQQQQPQLQQQSQLTRFSTAGGQTMKTVTVNSLAPIVKNTAKQNKTVSVVVPQQQNLGCLLKSTNSVQQLPTKEVTTVSNTMNSAQGQIISLESLLTKQGGTLRVTNASNTVKTSQAGNIIHLTPSSVQQDAPQYTVLAPQTRNLITVGTPHQLQSSQGGCSTATVFNSPMSISVAQMKDTTKYLSTSAKIMSSTGQSQTNMTTSQHMVNSNIFGKASVVSASNATGAPTGAFKIISTGGVGTNFNIANIHGKQVILTSKPASVMTAPANQGQKLQSSAIILGGQATKLQGNTNVKLLNKTGSVDSQSNAAHLQTVLVGNQFLRVDQLPNSIKQQIQTSRIAVSSTSTLPLTTVANTNTGTVVVNSKEAILHQQTGNMPKTFILGSSGQKIRLQQAPTQTQLQQTSVGSMVSKNVVSTHAQKINTTKPSASRVVLAVQGGGQIFLSPNYQCGSVNLKSLQNVKVVSMGQSTITPSYDDQHQEITVKTSPPKFATQQSILRTSGSSNDKS